MDTDNLKLFLYLANIENYEDKVLEFRERLLDRNKNFIKEKQDIEFEKKL
ncbi:hypothetical protein JCM16776_1479 [Leptotrichia shahii]|uniref:Uncharacterized protein n=1 Tax=Leptotrichia shahii TaxID=157691 RepID=A0A510JS32_9FUSO|nr:hypothetical protein [Leptotrichia shahii]BBM41255.1 hypothetical protein JCM16776_1479 [Leptotrichia shahii]